MQLRRQLVKPLVDRPFQIGPHVLRQLLGPLLGPFLAGGIQQRRPIGGVWLGLQSLAVLLQAIDIHRQLDSFRRQAFEILG